MAKKAKRPVPQSREEASIKSFLDMIAPSVVSFMPDHFICGNTFRCVWALREYPTSTDAVSYTHLEVYKRQRRDMEGVDCILRSASDN